MRSGSRAKTREALVSATARRAVATINETSAGRAARGLHAYEVLAETLSAQASAPDPERVEQLGAWARQGLPALLGLRQAAVTYLSAALGAVSGDDRTAVSEALASYGEVLRLGRELASALLSLTRPAQGAEPPPEASWPEAANLVNQMKEHELRAASHLAAVAQ